MKKIVVSVVFLIAGFSAQSQGCGVINKASRALTLDEIEKAKTLFEEANKEIKAAEDKDQPLEAKCYAKYYYGAGSTALRVYNNSDVKDLVSKVVLLNKAEAFILDFFALEYQDKLYTSKAITELESIANKQKSIAVDFFNEGDFEQALMLLEKAIFNKSKLGENYLDLHGYQSALITALRIDEFEKALNYNAILIANPQLKINKKVNDQEENLVKKSDILNSMGRTQEAIAVLDSSIKVFPGSTKIQEAQLSVYIAISDDQASLDVLELLTQKIKDNERFYLMMGRIYNDKGFFDKSYNAYKTALSINPKSLYALYGMGAYYVNKSNEYVNSLNEVGSSASDNVTKSVTEAEREKNFDKAIHFFNLYLEQEPGDKATINALKKIYSEKGDDAKVEEINQKLIAN
jgi:tetratricopeptide (TPR) repeat protein|tara:strand:- start:1104 stop:2318 length:1215 start_codon:yes stop_codon:yes gene_type:complete